MGGGLGVLFPSTASRCLIRVSWRHLSAVFSQNNNVKITAVASRNVFFFICGLLVRDVQRLFGCLGEQTAAVWGEILYSSVGWNLSLANVASASIINVLKYIVLIHHVNSENMIRESFLFSSRSLSLLPSLPLLLLLLFTTLTLPFILLLPPDEQLWALTVLACPPPPPSVPTSWSTGRSRWSCSATVRTAGSRRRWLARCSTTPAACAPTTRTTSGGRCATARCLFSGFD